MKGIILLNGEPYNRTITKNKGDYVVCCDGAYNWAKDKVAIDIVLGDFDSLKNPPKDALRFPTDKDKTDGELAALHLLSLGYKDFEIYGGGGLREDHFLGNIALLYLIKRRGGFCKMINNKSDIVLISGKYSAAAKNNSALSIVPFTDKVHINESEGLKYPLNCLTLYKWQTRGISNKINGDKFFVWVKLGAALIVLNKEI